MRIAWDQLPGAIGVTVLLWVSALALSIVLAIPLTLLRRSVITPLRGIGWVWSTVARGVPPIMWLIVLYFGVAVGVLKEYPFVAAALGLSFVTGAYLSDGIAAGLDSVPVGQWEAIRAAGMSRVTGLWRVILPQAFPIMLATGVAYSITLLKNTALASIIGANELMYFIVNQVQVGSPALPTFLLAGLVFLVFTVPLGFAARSFERRSTIAMVR